jgi:hypothetical protein
MKTDLQNINFLSFFDNQITYFISNLDYKIKLLALAAIGMLIYVFTRSSSKKISPPVSGNEKRTFFIKQFKALNAKTISVETLAYSATCCKYPYFLCPKETCVKSDQDNYLHANWVKLYHKVYGKPVAIRKC